MSDPFIVLGINVRNVRMTWLVHFHVVLGRGLLLTSCRGRGARRVGSPRGSRTTSGNVSTANRGVSTALSPSTAASLLPTALRKSSHAA
jgi:hypothetical protein